MTLEKRALQRFTFEKFAVLLLAVLLSLMIAGCKKNQSPESSPETETSIETPPDSSIETPIDIDTVYKLEKAAEKAELTRLCQQAGTPRELESCLQLASMISHHDDTGKFNKTAWDQKISLVQKACNGAVVRACTSLARIKSQAASEISGDISGDIQYGAEDLYRLSCEGSEDEEGDVVIDAGGCIAYGFFLLDRKEDEIGKDETEAKARQLILQGCDLSHTVCHESAFAIWRDKPARALWMFEYICTNGGHAPSCLLTALHYETGLSGAENPQKASEYLQKMCYVTEQKQCWDSVKEGCDYLERDGKFRCY